MPLTSTDVAAVVKQRRLALGKSQRASSFAAGFSPTTWAALEKGEPVSDLTLVAAAAALHWPKDWLTQLQEGVDPDDLPTVEPEDEPDPVLTALRELTDRVAGLEQMLRQSGISEDGH